MTQPTYTGPPLPIGYVEMQASYVGEFDRDKGLELFGETVKRAAREHPGMIIHSTRWESVADGAGVMHHNFYLGLEPKHKPAEPLNPHNLNDAPMPQPGMMEPTDGIVPLGYNTEKFGRGGGSSL